MNRISLQRSIIKSTLFNITVSVFTIMMLLMLLFGRTFWEKESVKLESDLLKIAFNIREDLDVSLLQMASNNDPTNETTPKEQLIREISTTIGPMFIEKSPYSFVYYDLELEWGGYGSKQFEFADEVASKLSETREIRVLELKTIKLVSVPVIMRNDLKGYIWVYATNSEYTIRPYAGYSIAFGLMFMSLGITIVLIRRHMNNIQNQLEEFSESIAHPKTDQVWSFHELPELEPAFNKIIGYTQELNAMNEELKSSQGRINQIMSGITDGLFSIDRKWQLLFYNDVAKKVFGKPDEELMQKNMLEVFPDFCHSIHYHKLMEALDGGEPAHYEAKGIFVLEKVFHTSIYPFEEGITVFFRDITEQRQQQYEMARLERLNLVGQMAAGISHEIRNPLTTVKGFLQLRESRVKDPQEKEYNELMISEIDRANAIISEFLSLAKNNIGNNMEQDINQIIYRIFPMIQADANNGDKDLILNLNHLPSLLLNENEIRQLILNLVRNALEVTPVGGYVTIRTYEEQDNIVLAVQDQGCGIPEEIQEKIGTPFFTTKDSGTGLGVAISMGIAHRHNAELVFETGDQGTTFKVLFKK